MQLRNLGIYAASKFYIPEAPTTSVVASIGFQVDSKTWRMERGAIARDSVSSTYSVVGASSNTTQVLFINSVTGAIAATKSTASGTFTLSEGKYHVLITVTGTNTLMRFLPYSVTVLPALFTEGEADRVLTLGTGNNIYDASSWSDGENIFVKRSGATVGKLTITDLDNSGGNRSHILIDPSNKMTINSFSGGHGILFDNCHGVLFDACGNSSEEYNVYVYDNGLSTAHAVAFGFTGQPPCDEIELCGVETETATYGASGFRWLADETATYNRPSTTLTGQIIHNCKVIEAGHEGVYFNYTNDNNGGNGGPPQSDGTLLYSFHVVDSGRDAIQPCNCQNMTICNILIEASATLGEPSHQDYLSINDGCSGRVFNVKGKGGQKAVSHQLGSTGGELWLWNISLECNGVSGSTNWYTQLENGSNVNMHYWNITLLGDPLIAFRIDSTGTRDVDYLDIFNVVVRKGSGSNFLTVDGANSTTNWDVSSGNLSYSAATINDALIDSQDYYNIWAATSPAKDGGADPELRIPYADRFGSFDSGSIEISFDIDGYVTSADEHSGAFAGLLFDTGEPDVITRSFITNPSVGSPSGTAIPLSGWSLNKYGKMYAVAIPDGDTQPSNAQIIAGQDSTGSSAPSANDFDYGSGGALSVGGLSSGTAYDLWCVPADASGTNDGTAFKVDGTTSAVTEFDVYVDVGSSPATGDDGTNIWNDFATFDETDEYELVDTDNNPTGLTATIDANLNGVASGAIGTGGRTVSVGDIPTSVFEDYHSGGNTDTAQITISGCNPAMEYDVIAFGSRNVSDTDTNRRTEFQVNGGGWSTYNAALNPPVPVTISGVVPNGSDELVIEFRALSGSSFSYIGGFKILARNP